MTQRNPMNDRYNRDDLGQTRKSAASAKPAAKAHASVHIEGEYSSSNSGGLMGRARKKAAKKAQKPQQKGSGSKQREPTREEKRIYYDPDTPEYRTWRRNWWITIILALALTALSFLVQTVDGMQNLAYVMLGIGYVLLFVAIWIDVAKVRKIRNAYAFAMVNSETKAAKRERKQIEQDTLDAQAENAEKLAAERAKRAKRYGKIPFFGKRSVKLADEAQERAEQVAEVAEENKAKNRKKKRR